MVAGPVIAAMGGSHDRDRTAPGKPPRSFGCGACRSRRSLITYAKPFDGSGDHVNVRISRDDTDHGDHRRSPRGPFRETPSRRKPGAVRITRRSASSCQGDGDAGSVLGVSVNGATTDDLSLPLSPTNGVEQCRSRCRRTGRSPESHRRGLRRVGPRSSAENRDQHDVPLDSDNATVISFESDMAARLLAAALRGRAVRAAVSQCRRCAHIADVLRTKIR